MRACMHARIIVSIYLPLAGGNWLDLFISSHIASIEFEFFTLTCLSFNLILACMTVCFELHDGTAGYLLNEQGIVNNGLLCHLYYPIR